MTFSPNINHIEILNAQDEIMRSQKIESIVSFIDVSGLNSGIYFIKFSDGRTVVGTYKIVVQH